MEASDEGWGAGGGGGGDGEVKSGAKASTPKGGERGWCQGVVQVDFVQRAPLYRVKSSVNTIRLSSFAARGKQK